MYTYIRGLLFHSMSDTFPLEISVVIPVYNAAKFIQTAVDSALQFNEVREVLLVDDAGPDDSLAICKAIALREPRVKLLQHPGGVNKGAGASRNLGMLKSSSELIAFLDADDFYLPNRFNAERTVFRENPDADGVYGAIAPHFYDSEGKARFEETFQHALTTVRYRVPPERLFAGLVGSDGEFGHFHLDTLTLKRSALHRVVPWMRPELKLHQDTDFLRRLAWHVRLYPGLIEEAVAMRGVHAENRVTAITDFNANQYALHRAMWEWAVAVGCDRQTTEKFHFKYCFFAVASAPSKCQALRIAVQQRKYLTRYAFRDALFSRLAGHGSRIARLLHKFTWRFNALPGAKL